MFIHLGTKKQCSTFESEMISDSCWIFLWIPSSVPTLLDLKKKKIVIYNPRFQCFQCGTGLNSSAGPLLQNHISVIHAESGLTLSCWNKQSLGWHTLVDVGRICFYMLFKSNSIFIDMQITQSMYQLHVYKLHARWFFCYWAQWMQNPAFHD